MQSYFPQELDHDEQLEVDSLLHAPNTLPVGSRPASPEAEYTSPTDVYKQQSLMICENQSVMISLETESPGATMSAPLFGGEDDFILEAGRPDMPPDLDGKMVLTNERVRELLKGGRHIEGPSIREYFTNSMTTIQRLRKEASEKSEAGAAKEADKVQNLISSYETRIRQRLTLADVLHQAKVQSAYILQVHKILNEELCLGYSVKRRVARRFASELP